MLREEGNVTAFADLLLGISDPAGNYSAAEHALRPILPKTLTHLSSYVSL
jgi:hypothetical protein